LPLPSRLRSWYGPTSSKGRSPPTQPSGPSRRNSASATNGGRGLAPARPAPPGLGGRDLHRERRRGRLGGERVAQVELQPGGIEPDQAHDLAVALAEPVTDDQPLADDHPARRLQLQPQADGRAHRIRPRRLQEQPLAGDARGQLREEVGLVVALHAEHP
jgi:hypothetical protein